MLIVVIAGCNRESEPKTAVGHFDDFSGNESSGWEEYELEGSTLGNSHGWIEDESYHIRVDSSPYVSLQNYKGAGCSDFVLEADVTRISGPYDGAFGLVFRYTDKKGFYAATIHNEGYMHWVASDGSKMWELSEWLPCTEYHENNTVNRLAVIAQGPILRFYSNGVLQSEIIDYTHESGTPGLIVITPLNSSTPLHIKFDNIRFQPDSDMLTEVGGRFPLRASEPGTTCAIDLADKWPGSFADLYSTQLCVYGIGIGDTERDIEIASKQLTFTRIKSKKPRSKLRGIEKQSLKDLIGVDRHAEV